MKFIKGFLMAWGNFTIIPVPTKIWDENARKQMLFALPLVGLFIGAIWCGLYLVLNMTGIHPAMKGAVMTTYPFFISGCIHLDGFMDCSDAILSRRPMEDKQKILKDSHIGAFAVISVVLMFLMYFASMWAVVEEGNKYIGFAFLMIPTISRSIAASDVLGCPSIGNSQYKGLKKKTPRIFNAALILFLFLLIYSAEYLTSDNIYGGKFIIIWVAIGAMAAVGAGAGGFARKQLGGMNGDIAGYMIVWSELAAVITMGVALSWI